MSSMPDQQTTITCLASVEKAVEELYDEFNGEAMWWRGHAIESWKIMAGAFRPSRQSGKYNEYALISHFKTRALGMLGHRPRPTSEIEWLFLAQHYGLPTRLLDWTENPLVALFFALGQDAGGATNADACLWAMSPSQLNLSLSCPAKPGEAQLGLVGSDERVVQAMAKQAFGYKNEAIKGFLSFDPSLLPKALAIESPEMDARIVAQSGRFTLHGCDRSLESLSESGKYLRKFIIPGSEKSKLRQKLELMGVQLWNLFPDLQSLAEGLRKHEFTSSDLGGLGPQG